LTDSRTILAGGLREAGASSAVGKNTASLRTSSLRSRKDQHWLGALVHCGGMLVVGSGIVRIASREVIVQFGMICRTPSRIVSVSATVFPHGFQTEHHGLVVEVRKLLLVPKHVPIG